jgi:subtilisin family serine protease
VFSRATGEECKEAGYDAQVCALSWDSDQLRAFEYIYNLRGTHNIAAANVSIGGGKHPQHCDYPSATSYAGWARTLAAAGIATVVSSGNAGYSDGIGSPACNSTVISVGATTMANGADAVWERSNSAGILDLLAPGVHICSAIPGTQATPDAFQCWQGTSMAAPHVAGAFAVLRQLKPAVSATTVETEQNMLSASGAEVTDARNGLVRSRIDVWDALVALYNS